MVAMNESTAEATASKKRRRGRKQKSEDDSNKKTSSSQSNSNSNNSPLLIDLQNTPWFEYGQKISGRNSTIATHPPPFNSSSSSFKNVRLLAESYRTKADALFRTEVQRFSHSKNNTSSADERWVESTVRKGTLKDRIAAMSVLVSTDPIHKWYALDGLLQLTGCNSNQQREGGENGSSSIGAGGSTNSRVAQLAAEALEDLFLHTLLPTDRKLLTLAQRPLHLYENDNKSHNKKSLSPRILLLWRFEEMVKERYNLFIHQYLVKTLRHGAELDKLFCIRTIATLLRNLPESEAALLEQLVNKLGDVVGSRKVAAGAAHELRRVLQHHPAMQPIVAREVQQLAHRPHLSSHGLYNCIVFLNQLKLERPNDTTTTETETTNNNKSKEEPSLAASLISTYFRLFEVAVSGSTSTNTATTNNKKNDNDKNNKKATTTPDHDSSVAVKSRLLSALLTGVNRAHPYLPLKDQAMDGHVDAIYRVVHTATPATCTQALLLLFHVAVGSSSSSSSLSKNTNNNNSEDENEEENVHESTTLGPEQEKRRERFYRALYSTLSNPSMLGAGKHLTLLYNLLYKAIKNDTDANRVVAFCKRILTTSLHCCSPSVLASSLFLLNEIACKYHPIVLSCMSDVLQGPDAMRVLDSSKREPRGALIVVASAASTASASSKTKMNDSGDKKAPLWELALARHHFHPAVVKFTTSLGEAAFYSGDPLKDFNLGPFLDKFAYRNPKSAERIAAKYKRGDSVAERRNRDNANTLFAPPVNDPSFWQSNKSVDAQDEFFHTFFVERARRDALKGKKTKKSALDSDEEEEEEGRAFDDAEAGTGVTDGDQKKFEYFEDQWETDSEEEAFVDSLAEQIIEDAIDDGDAGPAELDDEDPDMNGWSDMDDDEDENEEKNYLHRAMGDENESEDEDAIRNEEDAFMEDSENDDDSEEDSEPGGLLDGEKQITSFADDENDDDDDGDDDDDDDDGDGDNSSDDDDLILVRDDSDLEEDMDEDTLRRAKNSKKKESLFAPLDEYEDKINDSFRKLKDTNVRQEEEGKEEANQIDGGEDSHKRKRKKKAKRRKTG